MSETIDKLRADRDLQCYFFRPSAIAALSNAGSTGFNGSGDFGGEEMGGVGYSFETRMGADHRRNEASGHYLRPERH